MKTWREVEGFFDYPYLYDQVIAGAKEDTTLVEVGSWLGQSMAYLAQGLQLKGWRGRLVAVDSFHGELNQPEHAPTVMANGGTIRPVFEQNMKDCGVFDMVEVMEGDSAASAENFADGSVSFCFIDAAHDYDSVVRDVIAWIPKIKPGGMLAGHDYPCPDVHKAVVECFAGTSYLVAGACWVKNFPLDRTPADWRDAIKRGSEDMKRNAKQ